MNVFSGKLATESAAPSKGNGSASQRTQTNLRHKQTSFRTFKDLDSWREVILYELEETYNHDLPRDRTSGAGTTKLAPLYPVRHLCITLCAHTADLLLVYSTLRPSVLDLVGEPGWF